jgi:radical SAM superfamily enzyme YgiQ (UPF0313 family)
VSLSAEGLRPFTPFELRQPGAILLVSCYELGHQPLTLASPLGLLAEAGYQPAAVDLSLEPGALAPAVALARFIGISVPMHTALRLGAQAAQRARQLNPAAHICFYGHYAWLNAGYLLRDLADSVIAGEYEGPLVELIKALAQGETGAGVPGVSLRGHMARPYLHRLRFALPRRDGLPPLDRYAHLVDERGHRTAGYVEASRGCLHTCLHCPITPVYNGRFFVVPAENVLADIRAQVNAGAGHISFGDPDFLNGPGHSLKIVRAMHAEFPGLTFDFTAKVEHLLEFRRLLTEFRRLGCAFIVSAFESVGDHVLARLAKGHTYAGMLNALDFAAEADIPIRPTFVAFTPWTSVDDYVDMLEFVRERGLVGQVDAVQYAIRLLVPPGSALAALPGSSGWLGALDSERFTYRWEHPDPRMDELYRQVCARVEAAARQREAAEVTFEAVCQMAYAASGRPPTPQTELTSNALRTAGPPAAARVLPHLTEAWFC